MGTNITVKATPSPKALKFFKSARNLMLDLAVRWADEHKYEDIADYQKPLDPIARRCGVCIEKMIKRPFGLTFSTDNRRYVLKLSLDGTYSYQRIA